MFESIISFIDRHQSFILTTHDSPDADGLGAEMVLASILKSKGKKARIINSAEVPVNLQFLENCNSEILKEMPKGSACPLLVIEKFDREKHGAFIETSALLILDTCEEHLLGNVREAISKVKETFVIDHHEQKPKAKLSGFVDSTASSASEIAVELACSLGVDIDPYTATAAYAGIVFDSGFFAYQKTTIRTFNAAIKTLEWGAAPNYIYRQLMENSSCGAILLQRQALVNLEFHAGRKIAVIVLRKKDYEIAGAHFEEADGIVNVPLRTKEVEVSILLKERPEGGGEQEEYIRCSLRSKGKVNVSKIAQEFGGGGHVTAAGFRSSLGMEEIIKKLLDVIQARLDQ